MNAKCALTVSPDRARGTMGGTPTRRRSRRRFDEHDVGAEVGEHPARVRGRLAAKRRGRARRRAAPCPSCCRLPPARRARASSRWRGRTSASPQGTSRCILRIQCRYGRSSTTSACPSRARCPLRSCVDRRVVEVGELAAGRRGCARRTRARRGRLGAASPRAGPPGRTRGRERSARAGARGRSRAPRAADRRPRPTRRAPATPRRQRLELGRGFPVGARGGPRREHVVERVVVFEPRAPASRIARRRRATRAPAPDRARPTSRRSPPRPRPTDRRHARGRALRRAAFGPVAERPGRVPESCAATIVGPRHASAIAYCHTSMRAPSRSRRGASSAASTATVAACADTKSGYAKPICTGSRSGQPMRWSIPAAAERL